MKLLHLDSGLFDKESVTRRLTLRIVERLRETHPRLEVIHRDLAAEPPSHLSAEALAAVGLSPEDRTAIQRMEVESSDRLLREFLEADVVVVGAPMYNFSIPSQLKAWVDRILRAGTTFRYTADGPQGLAGGKRVIVASARGGVYSEGEAAGLDFQERYLREVFSFIGIDDLTVIRAEGIAMGEDCRRLALAHAERLIAETAPLASVA